MNAPAADLALAAELTRLTVARDALAAENARLREAAEALLTGAKSAETFIQMDGSLMRKCRVERRLLDALRAALAARALVEAPR